MTNPYLPGYIEYNAGDHNHILSFDAFEFTGLAGDALEEIAISLAEELADAVARCTNERHKGHGRVHTAHQANEAFRQGIHQVLTTDYAAEERRRVLKVFAYKRWGGPVPKAILLPDRDEPKKMNAIITNEQGDPFVYAVKDKRINELMVPPEKGKAIPDKEGIGWRVDKRRLTKRQKLY